MSAERPGPDPVRGILIGICAGILFWMAAGLTILWGLS